MANNGDVPSAARPPPLDAKASFNNSVTLRITSKRLLQSFITQLASRLFIGEEEVAPAKPLVDTLVKDVCSLTYEIVKEDRVRLGELQERYNALVEANRRSQLGYMRELVVLRDKVRRVADDPSVTMSTGDYEVIFYDALQFLDQDVKELISTITNERVRQIIQTKKTSSSDAHSANSTHQLTQTHVPYPTFHRRKHRDSSQGPSNAVSHSSDSSDSSSSASSPLDAAGNPLPHSSHNHSPRTASSRRRKTRRVGAGNASGSGSGSEAESRSGSASSASATQAQGPRMAAETAAILRGTKSKRGQIARLVALIEERSALVAAQRDDQLALQQQIGEFREKLKELDVVKKRLNAEVRRRGKLEVEFGVLRRIVDHDKLGLKHRTDHLAHLASADAAAAADARQPAPEEEEDEEASLNAELQVFLRLYKDAFARVDRFNKQRTQHAQTESLRITKKIDSLRNDDPGMNILNLDEGGPVAAEQLRFLATVRKRLRKNPPPPAVEDWGEAAADGVELAIGKTGSRRRLILTDEPAGPASQRSKPPLPPSLSLRRKEDAALSFLCRDHGGMLPPTLACDVCRRLLQPPMGIGVWP